ncbi:hypothetical protein Sden_0842 [Shewanella denitrificans OS217]|jgi:hypothetical protein|uniref:Uncharacterized protein n=1 Tax=Shewanella denitrificans (strain OS217 / ATCC BAA-1090 / DSM 15013) TaxID=318161 RepID=Q12QZ6_SHEDO|nr:hypothetical protein Sden_0842 [Shewanella denitrificans OS217]
MFVATQTTCLKRITESFTPSGLVQPLMQYFMVNGAVNSLKIDENNHIIWLLYPFNILKKIKPLLDNKLLIWHASCCVKSYAHDY